jgi:hypothetical protein
MNIHVYEKIKNRNPENMVGSSLKAVECFLIQNLFRVPTLNFAVPLKIYIFTIQNLTYEILHIIVIQLFNVQCNKSD